MSGMLYAPGVPDSAEAVEMSKLVDTYGKTWHTWQVDRGDVLPLGENCSPHPCLQRPNLGLKHSPAGLSLFSCNAF